MRGAIQLWLGVVVVAALGCSEDPQAGDSPQQHLAWRMPAWICDHCGNTVYLSVKQNYLVAIITPYTGLGGTYSATGRTAVWKTHPRAGNFRVPFEAGHISLVDETHKMVQYPIPAGYAARFMEVYESRRALAGDKGMAPTNLLRMLKEVSRDFDVPRVTEWLGERPEHAFMSNVEIFEQWGEEEPRPRREDAPDPTAAQ